MVVKLVITSPCHGEGRGFESRPPRHLLKLINDFKPTSEIKSGVTVPLLKFYFKLITLLSKTFDISTQFSQRELMVFYKLLFVLLIKASSECAARVIEKFKLNIECKNDSSDDVDVVLLNLSSILGVCFPIIDIQTKEIGYFM